MAISISHLHKNLDKYGHNRDVQQILVMWMEPKWMQGPNRFDLLFMLASKQIGIYIYICCMNIFLYI